MLVRQSQESSSPGTECLGCDLVLQAPIIIKCVGIIEHTVNVWVFGHIVTVYCHTIHGCADTYPIGKTNPLSNGTHVEGKTELEKKYFKDSEVKWN